MTANDKKYLDAIYTDSEFQGFFYYKIDNPKEILKRINYKQRSCKLLVNCFMLKFLIEESVSSNNKYEGIVFNIFEEYKEEELVSEFFRISISKGEEFSVDEGIWLQLFKKSSNIVNAIFNAEYEDKRFFYIKHFFNFLTESEDIASFIDVCSKQIDLVISDNITALYDMYQETSMTSDVFLKLTENLNTQFSNISTINYEFPKDKDFLSTLFESNMVEINIPNIRVLLNISNPNISKTRETTLLSFFSYLLFTFDINDSYQNENTSQRVKNASSKLKNILGDSLYSGIRKNVIDDINSLISKAIESKVEFTDHNKYIDELLYCTFISDEIKFDYIASLSPNNLIGINSIRFISSKELYVMLSNRKLFKTSIWDYFISSYIKHLNSEDDIEIYLNDNNLVFIKRDYNNTSTREAVNDFIIRLELSTSADHFNDYIKDLAFRIVNNTETSLQTFESFVNIFNETLNYNFQELSTEKICSLVANFNYELNDNELLDTIKNVDPQKRTLIIDKLVNHNESLFKILHKEYDELNVQMLAWLYFLFTHSKNYYCIDLQIFNAKNLFEELVGTYNDIDFYEVFKKLNALNCRFNNNSCNELLHILKVLKANDFIDRITAKGGSKVIKYTEENEILSKYLSGTGVHLINKYNIEGNNNEITISSNKTDFMTKSSV